MQTNHFLEGYPDREKAAYLGAIASLATADRSASEDELEYIEALADAADLNQIDTDAVLGAARSGDQKYLSTYLSILKGSELRYAFYADIVAFAKSDGAYTHEEKERIDAMAVRLGVDGQQRSAVNAFLDKAESANPQDLQGGSNSLLGGSVGDMLSKAGLDNKRLLGTLVSVVAPMVLGGIMQNQRSARGRSAPTGGLLGGLLGGGSGGAGGALGGLLGGSGGAGGALGGLLGGSSPTRGGAPTQRSGGMLGSILGTLSQGGYQQQTSRQGGGGLLGSILGAL